VNKALFLDRDGVVNVEKNYVHKIEDFEFMDGVFDLCRRYQDDGHIVLVITNQAGISRGLYSEDDFARLTAWMVERFRDNGVEIGNVYHCPHHPDFSGPCDCRKPAPGMIFQARDEFDLDLAQCTLLGDKESDLEAGRRAGILKLGLVRGHRSIEGVSFETAWRNL
jgi:D-glycero-D-manno-heptose 1,7-bisphosphate phosphatase